MNTVSARDTITMVWINIHLVITTKLQSTSNLNWKQSDPHFQQIHGWFW